VQVTATHDPVFPGIAWAPLTDRPGWPRAPGIDPRFGRGLAALPGTLDPHQKPTGG